MALLPYLTKYLSHQDYGITSLITAYVLLLGPFLGFSSQGLFWVEFFRGKNKNQLSVLFSNYFWFVIFTLIVIIILFISSYNFFESYVTIPFLFFILIPELALFTLLAELNKTYFVNKKLPKSYFIYSLVFSLLDFGFSYYLVVYIFNSWEGRILGWLAGIFIQSLLFFYIFLFREKYLRIRFNLSYSKQLLKFGTPLIFHQMSKFVVNQSDKFFIVNFISLDALGIYSVGYTVGTLIIFVNDSISKFFTPFLFERLGEFKKYRNEIFRLIFILFIIMFIAFLILNFISNFLFDRFIDPKFIAGLSFVLPVSAAYLFWGGYLLLSGFLFYYKETNFLGRIAMITMGLNFILNWVFISNFGTIGAAYATLISFVISFIFCLIKVVGLINKYSNLNTENSIY